MNIELREKFLGAWIKYFKNAPLPVAYYYTDTVVGTPLPKTKGCFIEALSRAFEGEDLVLSRESIGCPGGITYTGFGEMRMPNFNYFLSTGIEGKLRGERYKKTPEIVDEIMKTQQKFDAPGKLIIMKRWDKLTDADDPDVVVFFAKPDTLSGLFTLSGFDSTAPSNISSPFSSGCASIFRFPMQEKLSGGKTCFLGMFDPSARPFVPADTLSFAVPFPRFEELAGYIEESFLITDDWEKVKDRMP